MNWSDDVDNNESRAVDHLLTASVLARKFDPERHIDASDNLDCAALLADCYSSSEQMLARAAWQLWNGGGPEAENPQLRDLVVYLDDDQFEALIMAMRIHRQPNSTSS